MIFCRNKSSGKYFIYIEDTPNGEFRLITPHAEIKSLNPTLFDQPSWANIDDLLPHGLINEQQLKRYQDLVD
jgi:hypothetical protein